MCITHKDYDLNYITLENNSEIKNSPFRAPYTLASFIYKYLTDPQVKKFAKITFENNIFKMDYQMFTLARAHATMIQNEIDQVILINFL